jgi:hypothetical protein
MLTSLRIRQKILEDPGAAQIFRSWMAERFPTEQGKHIRWFWNHISPDDPFPGTE